MQSTYENLVEFNLSESGVRPLTPRELVEDAAGLDGLLDQPLVYTQSNGTIELRRAIAAMYPGAGIDHIEVTNGGSEANFITTFNLIEPGDEVVMLVPNYMQTWGLSRAFGGTIREWRLVEDRDAGRWRVDLDGARGPGLGAHEDDRDLQSEQPDRRAPDRRRARRDRAGRRPARRLDPVGRGLSRRRARRRRRPPSMWGRSRTRDRHQRVVEGLRAARPAHRLDRRSAVADRVAVVVPRLRHHRARRAERSPRARRAAAGAPGAPVRAHARHPAPQPAADRSVAAPTRAASTGSSPKPARSSTCATTIRSTRRRSSTACARRRAC